MYDVPGGENQDDTKTDPDPKGRAHETHRAAACHGMSGHASDRGLEAATSCSPPGAGGSAVCREGAALPGRRRVGVATPGAAAPSSRQKEAGSHSLGEPYPL